MTVAASSGGERPILPGERSGVLHPGNLARYEARWLAPDPAVGMVVDQYWHVRWAMPDGDGVDQRVIDLPAVTLTIEEGEVPAALVVTGPHDRAWRRRIAGRGAVFAIRLRPAGLAVLGDLPARRLANATLPLSERLDPRLDAFLNRVAAGTTPRERARAADEAVRERLLERPPARAHLLANEVLDELRARIHDRTGVPLAGHFGVSERTVQRALAVTLGRGPKWVSRRIRLQAVAHALATRPDHHLAALAAELGYADQAHLTGDFRAVAGVAPSTYRRDLARLEGG